MAARLRVSVSKSPLPTLHRVSERTMWRAAVLQAAGYCVGLDRSNETLRFQGEAIDRNIFSSRGKNTQMSCRKAVA